MNKTEKLAIKNMVNECHTNARQAGWWHDLDTGQDLIDDRHMHMEKIALIHSEASEMLEGLRKGQMDDHLPERSMEEVEAADIAIRLFDYCGARNLDIGGAMHDKLSYNKKRPDHRIENRKKEGGKKA